jgi:hypothetical protein
MSEWLAMLLGAALKSMVVISAAWMLAFALRRQSAAARHLVWTAAATALLALPLLSVSMPALRVRTSAPSPLVSSIDVSNHRRRRPLRFPAPSVPQATPELAIDAGPRALAASIFASSIRVRLDRPARALALAHMAAAWIDHVAQASNRSARFRHSLFPALAPAARPPARTWRCSNSPAAGCLSVSECCIPPFFYRLTRVSGARSAAAW